MSATTAPATQPAPPPEPQQQPPAPPAPKQLWFTYKNGQMTIAEDPERYKFAEGLFKKAAGEQATFTHLRDFSILEGPQGERMINVINSKGSADAVPINQNDAVFSDDAIAYMSGALQQPPASSLPSPSTTPDPSRQPVDSTQAPPPPQNTTDSTVPNPSAATTSSDIASLTRMIEELRRELQTRPQYPAQPPQPMIIQMPHAPVAAPGAAPVVGAPLGAGPNDPNVQHALKTTLMANLPRFRNFVAQIPENDALKAQYQLLITQIEQLDQTPKTSGELATIQNDLYTILLNHLRQTFQGLPQPLQAHLNGLNGFNPNHLQNLLNAGAGAAPSLIELLDLHTFILPQLNTHLQNQIVQSGLALQIGFQDNALPASLQTLQTELAAAPTLSRLGAIDGEITTALRTHITTKITNLETSTQIFNPAFASARRAGLAAQTVDQLLLEPEQIRAEFEIYIRNELGRLPALVQAKIPLPNPASLPQLDPERLKNAFIAHINEELAPLPLSVKRDVAALPLTTIAECRAKLNAISQSLIQYLVNTVNSFGNPLPNTPAITAMLQRIGPANGAGGALPDLQALLNELSAAAPNAPTFNRLKLIYQNLERFKHQQKPFALRHPIITLVAITAIGLTAYLFATKDLL